jgi:SAM-dependent methyltransferase
MAHDFGREPTRGDHRPVPAFGRLLNWSYERLYHEFAWAYDLVSVLVSRGQWSAWRGAVLEHVKGPRVLELGFGTGHLLRETAARGLQPIGLDPSPQMHRIAARMLRRVPAPPVRVLGVAQSLPFADRAFDTVYTTFPGPYILEPASLAEVFRILAWPDGRFVAGAIEVAFTGRGKPPIAALAGRPGGAVELLVASVERAGFAVNVSWERTGNALVPVVVGTRRTTYAA